MKRKYTQYISGTLTILLILAVFVFFGVKSGDQLLGDIRSRGTQPMVEHVE